MKVKTCRECDENEPHEVTPGQRKATCDACGYSSHWQRATVVTAKVTKEAIDGNGPRDVITCFFVTETGHEYESHDPCDCTCPTHVGLKSDAVRLTFCCYSPARHDYKRRS